MYVDYNTYGYGSSNITTSSFDALGAIAGIMFLFIGIIMIFSIVCQWKLFKKAGKNGWEAIVPIYNMIVLFEISKTPIWMIILFFIPIGNIIVMFMLYINLAKQFGKGTGFGIGMVFLPIIFLPMLAFGKAEYIGNGLVGNSDNLNNNMNNNFQNINQPINNNINPLNQTFDNNNLDVNNSNINPVNNDLGFVPQMNNDLNNFPNNNITEDNSVIAPINVTNINETPSQNITEVPSGINNSLDFQPKVEDQPVSEQINNISQVSTSNEVVQENNSANIGFADLTNKIENIKPVSSESVCPNCGNKHNSGDMFCINCGSKLN